MAWMRGGGRQLARWNGGMVGVSSTDGVGVTLMPPDACGTVLGMSTKKEVEADAAGDGSQESPPGGGGGGGGACMVCLATAAGRSPGRGLTMHDEGKYMYGGAEWATVAGKHQAVA